MIKEIVILHYIMPNYRIVSHNRIKIDKYFWETFYIRFEIRERAFLSDPLGFEVTVAWNQISHKKIYRRPDVWIVKFEVEWCL